MRYIFEAQRCCVWVNARSSVHPINTETRGLEGWVDAVVCDDGSLDLSAGVTGRLELAVDRLSSGNVLYDRELKRRIDAKKYPLIAGQITRTFEHEMTIAVHDNGGIALTGDYVFDIREFNMKPPSMLMLKVYPEVGVRIELHGRAAA
jgi:hypothetical protein